MTQKKIGVLLVNLGTPDSYAKKDVRKYLREFLSDGRVIDIPKIFRMLLLYLIILPFRTRKSAHAYKTIWTKNGSPLLVYSKHLADKVQNILGEGYAVELAMRYQNPSVGSALQKLKKQNIEQLVVLPLFPQYASAATGSALEKVYEELKSDWNVLPLKTIPAFYKHEAFVSCFARRVEETLHNFSADYVLFSYHGLPERHILKSECAGKSHCLKANDCCQRESLDQSFCYRAQCFATTQAIARQLNLDEKKFSNSFQSRLGRTKWIEPYTDEVLPELAKKGIRNIAIACPAFVADCLETLEEIALRAAEQWKECGGENLKLIPSLNAGDDWAHAVAKMVQEV